MTVYNWIILACWAVFLVVWALMGAQAKRTLKSSRFLWGLRLGVMLAAVLMVGSLRFFNQHVTLNFSPLESQRFLPAPWGITGAVCAVLGIGLAVWARLYLGRNWGMPMSVKENPELVTTGPYALVRHPIYTGVLLALVGSTIVAGWWWLIVAIVAAIYFIYSATQEEKLMQKEFPNHYPAYKAHTKMLIPWVL